MQGPGQHSSLAFSSHSPLYGCLLTLTHRAVSYWPLSLFQAINTPFHLARGLSSSARPLSVPLSSGTILSLVNRSSLEDGGGRWVRWRGRDAEEARSGRRRQAATGTARCRTLPVWPLSPPPRCGRREERMKDFVEQREEEDRKKRGD